ncbi:MAG: hypothetical protein ACI9N1_001738 [Flavobacteriales bacterium]|jgi:hypothetical protein
MKLINKEIANWIKPYVSIIGDLNEVDESLKRTHPSKYFVNLTIPEQFEKYAISLHSYWLNDKLPIDKIVKMKNCDKEFTSEDYERITWEDFYFKKGKSFKLEEAILDSVNCINPSIQLSNEFHPSEGDMDIEQLSSITKEIQSLYGNQEIEVFFHFLATKNWDDSLLFECTISQLLELIAQNEFNNTPSLIYAKDKSWVINTDYDLSFSTIGGESKLINRILENHNKEIFEVSI